MTKTMRIRQGCDGGGKGALVQDEKSGTLATNNDQYVFEGGVHECIRRKHKSEVADKQRRIPDDNATLWNGGGNIPFMVEENKESGMNPYEELRAHCRVRRFTPMECERLQGLLDGWTDVKFSTEEITPDMIVFMRQIFLDWDRMTAETPEDAERVKPRSDKYIISFLTGQNPDSARYKAIGNGIAAPFWKVLIKRISAQYDRDATMGSLFDGIGTFPWIWEQVNGKGSVLWSSEVDPYPIKITMYQFK